MNSASKNFLRGICPPFLWQAARHLRSSIGSSSQVASLKSPGEDMRWHSELTELLERWGEGNAWDEVRMLFMQRSGTALDIGCGTGRVMEILSENSRLHITGCDVTEEYLNEAKARGISADRLALGDARSLKFADKSFDYSYSVGINHFFSLQDLRKAIPEFLRVTRKFTAHHIAVSRSGIDEGWCETYYRFQNNSCQSWLNEFREFFPSVYVVDSKWSDSFSVGKWIVASCE
ncbi:MAG: class I SAM-dependent methyltransferase [Bdellovibrionales bacterium]|nr:class I SAM-dependent methyltransferase [Bdellovibrionales bacterium]